MFAYLATRDVKDVSACFANVSAFAAQHGVPASSIHTIRLSDFRVDFFDNGAELSWYRSSRYAILLIGTLANRESIQFDLEFRSNNDAELVLELFSRGENELSKIDGHLSFVLFDAVDGAVTMMGDRFHRYSVLYSHNESTFVASHSKLLYPFLADKSVDMASFSQLIHFRWLTGERKLFRGIKQVLPGSLETINRAGSQQRSRYSSLEFQRRRDGDINDWINRVDVALDRCLSQIAKRNDVIGIPLSGGVDSSLLLAKAKGHFKKCIAVTARFLDGDNPELDNAQYVAEALGVTHVIADIDADFIREMFPVMVGLHEQPPRNFSDFALARILASLQPDVSAFLYGEAADTFFGLSAVHRIAAADKRFASIQRLPLAAKRLLAKLTPDSSDSLRRLKFILEHGIDELIYSIERIKHATPAHRIFNCSREPLSDPRLNEFLAHGPLPTADRAAIQLLATGVMNHIENTGRLASYYGLQMYVPFVMNDLRRVAMELPFELQYDREQYKPVLKELACRYLERDYVYSDKHGFPTPTIKWLDGPLKGRVEVSAIGSGAGRQFYSTESLANLSLERDFEHFWFAICVDELLAQLVGQSLEISVAA